MTMRKGRPSLRKTVGGTKGQTPLSQSSPTPNQNWTPIPNLSSLPKEKGVVKLVETFAPALTDPRTNPNGAVSVANYDEKTFCFSMGCSSCKIPLTKARIIEANEETDMKDPRIACDFCGSTYNIRTGECLADSESKGIVGGVMKGLFAKNKKEPLRTFDLGERNGKVLINLK